MPETKTKTPVPKPHPIDRHTVAARRLVAKGGILLMSNDFRMWKVFKMPDDSPHKGAWLRVDSSGNVTDDTPYMSSASEPS